VTGTEDQRLMAGDGGELLAHPMLLRFPIRRLLRNLDVERNSFCSLTVAETDGGKLAMQRRLGRSSTAVGVSSGGAPAVESAPAAAERLGEPPSRLCLARQASNWHGVDGSVW
jgi:hypothetical protein